MVEKKFLFTCGLKEYHFSIFVTLYVKWKFEVDLTDLSQGWHIIMSKIICRINVADCCDWNKQSNNISFKFNGLRISYLIKHPAD